MAGRLSEGGKFSVLLLEEGGTPVPPTVKSHPAGIRDHPAINREFTSLPQTNFAQDSGGVSSIRLYIDVFGSSVNKLCFS